MIKFLNGKKKTTDEPQEQIDTQLPDQTSFFLFTLLKIQTSVIFARQSQSISIHLVAVTAIVLPESLLEVSKSSN